tara:strand:+ start:194 stop:874 length:681 start_codon:yes stop_codon:yes gene_type:complete
MIPKIIHQVYVKQKPDSVFPKEYERCQKTVFEHHPDFEYKLYDENDMLDVIKTHCPEYLDEYNRLPRMIMKIDMFRIMLMYVFGGIWVDFDYFFFKPYDLFDYKIVIPCNKEDDDGNPISIANAILASEPRQLFWKKILDTLFTHDRTKRFQSEWDVIRETGPQFLSKMWKEYEHKDDIYVPKRALFHPPSLNATYNYKYIEELRESGIYGIHFCTSLWFHGKNYL